MIPLSVLDTCPIAEGDSPADALRRSLERAQAADRLGYRRLWISEHHNMPGTAGSATAVVIGRIAGATATIRVGSGGVMLPNHAPYMVAEQFGTLAAYHPGRIDLGLGRSPGTDALTLRALRRDPRAAEHFADDLQELLFFLGGEGPGQAVRAIPGAGADAELSLWVLGSSLASAELAAKLGLAYAYASHVSPDNLMAAIQLYRAQFVPSRYHDAPYVMPCINLVAADSDAQARRLFTTMQRGLVNFFRGKMGGTQPPIDDIEAIWTTDERRIIEHMHRLTIVGSAETVAKRMSAFVEMTGADEVMIAGNFFEQAAHIRSLELVASAWGLAAEHRPAFAGAQ
jgi:luciferase family oxidoreductase group 1